MELTESTTPRSPVDRSKQPRIVHFDYDQKAPLDVQEAGVEQRGDVTIHDISYASPKGGRVPA